MAPRECDNGVVSSNQTAARNRRDLHRCCPVDGVKITLVEKVGDKFTVTFTAADTSGALRTMKSVWGDEANMWAYCPSTLPSGAVDPGPGPEPPTNPGAPPAVGASGRLFLEVGVCTRNSLRLPSGEEDVTRPKWPDRLGDRIPTGTIPVELEELVLVGFLQRNVTQTDANLNLLDPALVPDQAIEIGHGSIEVLLTRQGLDWLGVEATDSQVVAVDAARLELKGIELANGLRRKGTVDLMNPRLAPRRQHITIDRQLRTQIRLTQKGFNRFRVGFLAAR